MKMIIWNLFAALWISTISYAGYDLAFNGKKLHCYVDDNKIIEMNAKRSTIKFTNDGESIGPQEITTYLHDEGVLACYETSEGMLCLNDGGDGDTFYFTGDSEATPVSCE